MHARTLTHEHIHILNFMYGISLCLSQTQRDRGLNCSFTALRVTDYLNSSSVVLHGRKALVLLHFASVQHWP